MGVVPDLLVVAKGLASGMPLSAMLAPRELMAQAWAGSQGGTYGGNAVACAAALATLDVIAEEGLVEHAAEQGCRLLDGLRAVSSGNPAIGDVRGIGLMVATELVDQTGAPDAKATRAVELAAVDEGLLLLTCGVYNNVLRFVPPLVVNAAQVDEALAMYARALKRI